MHKMMINKYHNHGENVNVNKHNHLNNHLKSIISILNHLILAIIIINK